MPVKLFEIITATAQEQSAQVAMSITRKNARDTTIEAMEEITKEVSTVTYEESNLHQSTRSNAYF